MSFKGSAHNGLRPVGARFSAAWHAMATGARLGDLQTIARVLVPVRDQEAGSPGGNRALARRLARIAKAPRLISISIAGGEARRQSAAPSV
jgi:hypothetical protein